MANFRLEIRVEEFSNSDNDCGGDRCDLYINWLCLDPDPLNVCNTGSCSLDGDSRDYDLESGLSISLTAESQPWPVSKVTLLRVYVYETLISCVGSLSIEVEY